MFLVLALLVRASGPGPVFYRQERVGQGGTHFGMMKFRSMIDGADATLQALLAEQGREGTPLFKVVDDPASRRSVAGSANTPSTSCPSC